MLIEFLITITLGMLLGWFVFKPPAFAVRLRNILLGKYPDLKPLFRDDVY